MTKIVKLIVAAGVVALAHAHGATAGPAEKTPNARPAFEHVHALALDAAGRALWLGAHAGLFRSEDAGVTWSKIALPVMHNGPDVMAVTPHPRDAAVLYLATHETGVLKTTDGGRTWSAVNSGLGGPDIHGLAIDPNAPDRLHALVRDKGVYRTTNGGQKWIRVDDGPGGETKVLASVNIPTGMGGIFLYAGTGDGLQLSPDCF